jgi:hypothetical protein
MTGTVSCAGVMPGPAEVDSMQGCRLALKVSLTFNAADTGFVRKLVTPECAAIAAAVSLVIILVGGASQSAILGFASLNHHPQAAFKGAVSSSLIRTRISSNRTVSCLLVPHFQLSLEAVGRS